MSKCLLYSFACLIFVAGASRGISQDDPATEKQVFGPSGIMDTSPIVEVPVVEEEPVDHETIDKIPLAERLAKYDLMLGDLPRAGNFTPYYKGQLIGDLGSNSAMEPGFIPFIWLAPEIGRGKRVTLYDERSSNRRYDELELAGNSSEKAAWTTRTIPVSPGKLYRFSLFASSSRNGGELSAGMDFAKSRWQNLEAIPARKPNDYFVPRAPRRSFLFLTPEDRDDIQVKVGPGKQGFTYGIHRVHVEPVFPIYRGVQSATPLDVKVIAGTSSFIGLPGNEPTNTENRGGDFLRLGDGERIEQGVYHFTGTFGGNGYFHRPLQSTTATFDTDRLVFAKQGDELVYRFELQPIRIDEKPGQFVPPAIAFGKGKVRFDLRNATNTTVSLDWSRDGTLWEPLPKSLTASDKFVENTLDAKNATTLYLRLKNTGTGSFAVAGVSLEAEVDSTEYAGEGKTVIATLRPHDHFHQPIEGCKTVPLMFSADNAIYKLFINESETDQDFSCGYMDYGGTEDNPGGHGDGPGKWTRITFGSNWGTVRPHHARTKVWAYNWFGGANFFTFNYPGFSFSYEIVDAKTTGDENQGKININWLTGLMVTLFVLAIIAVKGYYSRKSGGKIITSHSTVATIKEE